MQKFAEPIELLDLSQINLSDFKRRSVGCIVLTKDHQILLQHRPNNWRTFPGCLATFGGQIEQGETPIQALVRELKEELGAQVNPKDLIPLGAITEAITNYTELIYAYFWHDKSGTITGCYEAEARYYDSVKEALSHPKIMDDVRWMLRECQKRQLIPIKQTH
ncbi:MAG: NUDIX hydrolase [Gammaproteobacteria bacterium]|nr:NUDIX hydrolase [Gammaproteobacteria bacterium]